MTPILFAATTKADVSLAFYRDVLGFPLVEDGPFALVFDANGTMLRVQKVAELVPHPFTALGWRVSDIAGENDRLAARGAEFMRFEFLEQDERGIWTAPDGAQVCWFADPDGNTLSLTQWPD